jgi:hypothetical protein
MEPTAMGAVGAAERVSSELLKRSGGTRKRRERLLRAVTELDAFVQSVVGPLADAAARGQGLPNRLEDWQRLTGSITGLAFADSDRNLKEWAERLRAEIQPWGMAFTNPLALVQIGLEAEATGRFTIGQIVGGLLGRLEYLLRPRWRKFLWWQD